MRDVLMQATLIGVVARILEHLTSMGTVFYLFYKYKDYILADCRDDMCLDINKLAFGALLVFILGILGLPADLYYLMRFHHIPSSFLDILLSISIPILSLSAILSTYSVTSALAIFLKVQDGGLLTEQWFYETYIFLI